MTYSSSMSHEGAASETQTLSHNPSTTTLNHLFLPISPVLHHQTKPKKKRSQPGHPDPEAEVVAMSPKSLMATNRFVCEICNKGFQRDQNLQLHRRGHNLPWKLRQRNNNNKDEVVRKRVYVCPEPSCVHHHPSRALGDLTGIKKHYSRKHGEKKWKCDKCSKRYAVHSDWKAHVKNCGTKEYKCDCGILFSRKDGFITHRAFCDALAQESARVIAAATAIPPPPPPPLYLPFTSWNPNPSSSLFHGKPEDQILSLLHHSYPPQQNAMLSATDGYDESRLSIDVGDLSTWQKSDRLTRDFLGVEDEASMGLDLVTHGDHTTPLPPFGIPTWSDC
ncbi:hypothetical protein J5N97_016042 [Dioscorea zingiberensis]|uniref:Protein EARLY HEADING DATE 2 n=1 Tax=Dioscorea zingiberensis TaxID=325984 RepID=A0A9D5CIZ8_9LILI|nr:hypothetical protein J5N97_016042 [Dioscorea zingiberensis]